MWSDLTRQNMIDCARHGVPSELISMPLAGATAQVTIAGVEVQHTAERMSGLAICQLAACRENQAQHFFGLKAQTSGVTNE
jgi:trimethylamine:corrinoid methyltransferase-like protein